MEQLSVNSLQQPRFPLREEATSVLTLLVLMLVLILVKLELEAVGFCGGRKSGEPNEKPSDQGTKREPGNNKLNPHLALGQSQAQALV